MATTIMSSMPDRPLTKTEVLDMDARAYCIDPDADEAYVIVLFGETQVHALGYAAAAGGWVQFESEPIENSDTDTIDAFEDVVVRWTDDHYAERLGDGGDLKISGEGDSTETDATEEREVPWEVEQGLEAEYDCPDCEYYTTGLSTGPHAFLDHLEDEHGYSRSEAHEILNG